MSKNDIASTINDQIISLTALVKSETNIKKKVYYFNFLATLERLKYTYTKSPYNMIYGDSELKKEMQSYLLNKEIKLIETIENSKDFIKIITEAVLEYINSTSSCIELEHSKKVDGCSFSKLMFELLKMEGLDSIYGSNKSKEIIDFTDKTGPGEKYFAASYNLLSLDGKYLVMIKENEKNLSSLLSYSHEYGHFLTDYLFDFDLEKKSLKNHAYNEIMSEILHMKLRKILLENDYMSVEREKQEEISFVTDMIIMYIYSHYDLIANENPDAIIKQSQLDISMKYPKISTSFKKISYDRIISAYMYGLAKYIGNLYTTKDINAFKAQEIILRGSENPLDSLVSIGLDEANFNDKEIIKDNLSKILIRK